MRSYSYCQKSWKNTKQTTTKMGSNLHDGRRLCTKSTRERKDPKYDLYQRVVQSYAESVLPAREPGQGQC